MGKNSPAYVGYIEMFPSKTNSSSNTTTYSKSYNMGKRHLTQTSNEVERITKNVFKDDFVGSSNQFSKKQKAEVFVEKSTGRAGFKEETTYTSTTSFDDKVHGCSSQYQTQVKFKKVTFPSQSGAKPALTKSKGYGGSTSKNYGSAPKSSAKGGKSYYY